MMNSFTMNGTNQRMYKDGNVLVNSIFISKTFLKNFAGILQLRCDYKGFAYSYQQKIGSSGGYKFILVPQLNYNIKKKYNLSVLYELPVYENYYGIQLKDLWAFSVNLNVRLGLNSKVNAVCAKP